MARLVDALFKDEERSRTILATVAVAGGALAIIIAVVADRLK